MHLQWKTRLSVECSSLFRNAQPHLVQSFRFSYSLSVNISHYIMLQLDVVARKDFHNIGTAAVELPCNPRYQSPLIGFGVGKFSFQFCHHLILIYFKQPLTNLNELDDWSLYINDSILDIDFTIHHILFYCY